jgi:hypothetical protein
MHGCYFERQSAEWSAQTHKFLTSLLPWTMCWNLKQFFRATGSEKESYLWFSQPSLSPAFDAILVQNTFFKHMKLSLCSESRQVPSKRQWIYMLAAYNLLGILWRIDTVALFLLRPWIVRIPAGKMVPHIGSKTWRMTSSLRHVVPPEHGYVPERPHNRWYPLQF